MEPPPKAPGASPAPPSPQLNPLDAQIQIVRGQIDYLLGRASRSQQEEKELVAARRTLDELEADHKQFSVADNAPLGPSPLPASLPLKVDAPTFKAPLGAPVPSSSAPASLCVAIVCARATEGAAVRRVFEKEKVAFKEATTKSKYLYHHAIFTGDHCSIKLAVISAEVMGSKNTLIVRDVLDEFAPQCLIMTGICAGRPDEVSVGDIVVAERASDMNEGKRGPDGLARALEMITIDANLRGFIMEINSKLKELVAPLSVTKRPKHSNRYKREVIFRLLYDAEKLTPTEIVNQANDKYEISIRNEWRSLMSKLVGDDKEPKKPLRWEGATLTLTAEKRKEMEEEMTRHLREYPSAERTTPKGHLGPYAVDQSAVVSDLSEERWKELAKSMAQRKLMALDMEAVVVYEAARHYNEAHPERHVKFLVVKAVVDFADTYKDDPFQHYCAELSAAWAFVFLKRFAAMACGPQIQHVSSWAHPLPLAMAATPGTPVTSVAVQPPAAAPAQASHVQPMLPVSPCAYQTGDLIFPGDSVSISNRVLKSPIRWWRVSSITHGSGQVVCKPLDTTERSTITAPAGSLVLRDRAFYRAVTLLPGNGCANCGKDGFLWRCSRCHSAFYCSTVCQTTDWPAHKGVCGKRLQLKFLALLAVASNEFRNVYDILLAATPIVLQTAPFQAWTSSALAELDSVDASIYGLAAHRSLSVVRLESFIASLPTRPQPPIDALKEWAFYMSELCRRLRKEYAEYLRIFPERAKNTSHPWAPMEPENMQRLVSVETKMQSAFQNLFNLCVPFLVVLATSDQLPQKAQITASLQQQLFAPSLQVSEVRKGSWIITGWLGYVDGLRVAKVLPTHLLGHSVADFQVRVSLACLLSQGTPLPQIDWQEKLVAAIELPRDMEPGLLLESPEVRELCSREYVNSASIRRDADGGFVLTVGLVRGTLTLPPTVVAHDQVLRIETEVRGEIVPYMHKPVHCTVGPPVGWSANGCVTCERPCRGGRQISVSTQPNLLGSFGGAINYGKQYVGMSCAHVLHTTGAKVYQPHNKCTDKHVLGNVTYLSNVSKYPSLAEANAKPPNEIDFGYFVTTMRQCSSKVAELSMSLRVLRFPCANEVVCFYGAKTCVRQEGNISLDHVWNRTDDGHSRWKGMRISHTYACPGDSGTLVIAKKDSAVVGMISAGPSAGGEPYVTTIPPPADSIEDEIKKRLSPQ